MTALHILTIAICLHLQIPESPAKIAKKKRSKVSKETCKEKKEKPKGKVSNYLYRKQTNHKGLNRIFSS